MEKILKLRTYVDGSDNDALFPSVNEPAEITSFTYNAKRMGDAPNITFTLYHTSCLDNLWNDKVYCWFNDEKYFLKQVPSSSYDNTESRYKHSAEMVSERMELNNVYFFDVVAKETEYDKPSSNSTNVVFHGDIHEFASRLNYSLIYSHLDYRVVVDEGVESEDKQMSFDKQFFFSVLQEVYNTYNIPFYFVGKEIHIGHYESELDEVFEYGVDKSLLSVAKNNTNNRIINRSSGLGSSENIPYYYPNKTPYGDINILYNGNVTTDVNITDWARFASCGLNGSLEYLEQHIDKPKATIGDINSLTTSSITKTPFLGSYTNTWEGKFEFKAEGAFNKLYLAWESLIVSFSSWRIAEEHDVTMQDGTFPPIDGIDLDYGNYTLYLCFNVGYRADEDEILKYIKEHISINIELEEFSCSRIGWVLDGKRNVSLGALGMVQVTTPNIGDTIRFEQTAERVPIMSNLMPSIYRKTIYDKTDGEERFYNALNNTYINPETGEYYYFTNPFVEGKRREHIEQFDDIKPTIVGIKNAGNEFIDEIIDVAFDDNDNDEKDESGKYLHPYFYVKLRKFDGDNGFNLFAQAIEGGDMTISMTSGACAACQWKIGVDEDTLLNPVQVNEDGSLKRDANGDVIRKGVAQARQNDTRTNEVWVALMKEDSTFGVLMPNALNNYRPKKGDKFVILNIQLPQAYIEAAEKRLEEAIIKHMYENNDSKFNFSIKFSRIYFAENADVLKALNENVLLKIRYNGQVIPLHVSSFSYKMQHSEALPEISVELSDTLTIHRSVAQQVASAVKSGVNEGLSNLNVPELGHPYFVSKVADDIVGGRKEFTDEVVIDKTLASSNFERNATLGTGWGLYKNANGDSVLEADVLIGRKRLEISELLVNQVEFQKGTSVVSNAGCSIESVEEHDSFFRCFFNTEQDTQGSGFVVGDQARCQRYDATYTNITKYYWRLVVGVAVGYVDLSKTDKDGDGAPEIGDSLVQLGHRTNIERQNAIFISSYPEPSIIQYSGINSYSLDDKIVTKIAPDDNRFTGKVVFRAGSAGLENLEEWADKQAQINTIERGLNSFRVEYDETIRQVESQLDNKANTWYQDFDPSQEWTTDELKQEHIGDLWYDTNVGQSFMWNGTEWVTQGVPDEIFDTIDGKSSIFVRKPETYRANDVWILEEDYNLSESYVKGTWVVALKSSDTFVPTHWKKLDSYADKTYIDSLETGSTNLLLNSGFTGDYISTDLHNDKTLDESTQMYSPNLQHWGVRNVIARTSDVSQSGVEAELENGTMAQTLKIPIVKGNKYIFSLRGKGQYVMFGVGGVRRTFTLNNGWNKFVEKFVATETSNVINISGAATICELQLTQGDITNSWSPSVWDNSSELAYYQSLQYLSNAIANGSTTTLGGLILSNILLLGNYANDEIKKATAGVSGIYTDDNDPAFWAGGSMDKAIATVSKFRDNPSYQPTAEEWANMSNFVATHGGDVFMRGYIYALGGLFRGAVSIANGKIQLNADGSGSLASGAFAWDKYGRVTSFYPARVEWINVKDFQNGIVTYDGGGYIEVSGYDGNDTFTLSKPVRAPFLIRMQPPEAITRANTSVKIYAPTGSSFKHIKPDGTEVEGETLYFSLAYTSDKGYLDLMWDGKYFSVSIPSTIKIGDIDKADISIY